MVAANATQKAEAVEEFATIIRRQIERQGLTQKEVADRAGMDCPALSNILAAKREPGLAMASKIAEAVGLRLTLSAK